MLFNSYIFLLFFPLVFLIYWSFNKYIKLQNLFVLIASYIFYGWWDVRFLSLIFISSLADYLIALKIDSTNNKEHRKYFLWLSIAINIGILGFFKYFNFFIGSFEDLLAIFKLNADLPTLKIILPVGISFYTFQTLSYTIDVYRKQITPTKDIVAFFSFVSFFPQLVAGPIERATHLLPQFLKSRNFDYDIAKDGLRQILWGFFKKVVIADQCAEIVEKAFSSYGTMPAGDLWFAALLFSFQIYADFSGYSDIAIGCAKLFGIDLMQNFRYPYLAQNVKDFWHRWHISLSTWFRDYVYIPLGGNQEHRDKNIFITFMVSGLWHGANWTFVCWGILNGFYYLAYEKISQYRLTEKIHISIKIAATFLLMLLTWVFFRAQNIREALIYIKRMFVNNSYSLHLNLIVFALIVFMYSMEAIQRNQTHPLKIDSLPLPLRWLIYIILLFLVCIFWGTNQTFIYFQF